MRRTRMTRCSRIQQDGKVLLPLTAVALTFTTILAAADVQPASGQTNAPHAGRLLWQCWGSGRC
jgi:hypothetical protein